MRIGIDARYLSHGLTGGVHSYVLYLVSSLLKYFPEHTFFIYADQKRPFEITPLPPNAHLRLLPYSRAISSFSLDFSLRHYMARDNLDVVHFPGNYGFGPEHAGTVITLHDSINIQPLVKIIRGHPKTLRTITMMTYLHLSSRLALRGVDKMITVSEFSKRDILSYCQIPASKIKAITHGPDPVLGRIEDPLKLREVINRYDLKKPIVLADALKNPAVIIRAWAMLPEKIKQDWQMVFFSRNQELAKDLRDAAQSGFVRVVTKPPFDDLVAFYSLAKIFLFPSWFEGLGLPLLEAMTCGTPIIASDRGAIPEIVDQAGLLMDAEDDQKLAELITFLYDNSVEQEKLRQSGYARASEFRWENVVRKVMDCYEEAIAYR